jgi:hypothetical protein
MLSLCSQYTITAGEVRKNFTVMELLSHTDLASVQIRRTSTTTFR